MNQFWDGKDEARDGFREAMESLYRACCAGDGRSLGWKPGVPVVWIGDALGLHALDNYGEHCGCCDWIPQAEWKLRYRLFRILRGELRRDLFRAFLVSAGAVLVENVRRPVPYLEWIKGR